ncbi:MAG: RdgB/HAM1 family non-canonical purine NTP pyrophosphatase [Gammaproteobacteria bacterium]|jgi:XTP/dITP diphosphohydrolase|nr:RdgB/HAM1 family non-canonical purine NTP pyrophosphatase [Gammaproteobacteria bacterium]MBT6755472.1 RdgB/HAM1 family non-canonical purine NTP pyrophosphatase [Gammaproteobacteria bacterium]MBT7523841.1 RdgB/HAM1 family non-canonical purine NTP pyrophosphatase [Gammaproteobacteria bacterium]MBT7814370.1 RdgB/HAM1 family non-canonical purine NTP pyrophosphatase [Gammaproteobacteria bacterium]|tara:strand:+ start:774 stop:1370 length:597 start_codon:yes stop_codon:yes gene_type:complete
MSKIVLASNNSHKIKEFSKILDEENIQLISQSKLDIPEADETGLTFLENSIIKARNASLIAKLPAIADDSGIEVDALNGRPGIYSARYAGLECDDKANNKLLLKELKDIPFSLRTARYHCTIVYLSSYDHPVPKIYNATWEGYIGTQEIGKNGFGYDPLFYLPEYKCTAAELSESVKNTISHRGQALKTFKEEFIINT